MSSMLIRISRNLTGLLPPAILLFTWQVLTRPKEEREFVEGNLDFTAHLLALLKKHNNSSPIIFSSSSQAALDNPYGKSKKAAEDVLFQYSSETGSPVRILRFPNVYGKWCRPSYNSVVATFCHNIAHGLPITINNPDTMINLIYIDDTVSEIISLIINSDLAGCKLIDSFNELSTVSLLNLSTILSSFKASRENKLLPDLDDPFRTKLWATYLSYLPQDKFSYPLKMIVDQRGSFTEIFRTKSSGQVSVNISHPGITKGNHWHKTKNEKFLVVSGKGIIRLRKYGEKEILEYKVCGENIEVVDIPPGYTHNITNTGDTDMVTIMWVSEAFDPEKPDTFYEEV